MKLPFIPSNPIKLAAALSLSAFGLTSVSHAVTFSFTSGGVGASASFNKVGSSLVVVLTNTGTGDVLAPADVLTGVFFNVAGNPALASTSAVLTAGSAVENGGPSDAGGVVGGEWGYLNGLSQYGVNSGISSSGLGGVFGNATFPGNDLQAPTALDGVEYGIASAGDDQTTGNGGITGQFLIKNSVTFTLGSFAGTAADISGVTFQYGTALTEPHFGGTTPSGGDTVPDGGATVALLGLALAGCAAFRRRA
jgi:hypothetical protein